MGRRHGTPRRPAALRLRCRGAFATTDESMSLCYSQPKSRLRSDLLSFHVFPVPASPGRPPSIYSSGRLRPRLAASLRGPCFGWPHSPEGALGGDFADRPSMGIYPVTFLRRGWGHRFWGGSPQSESDLISPCLRSLPAAWLTTALLPCALWGDITMPSPHSRVDIDLRYLEFFRMEI